MKIETFLALGRMYKVVHGENVRKEDFRLNTSSVVNFQRVVHASTGAFHEKALTDVSYCPRLSNTALSLFLFSSLSPLFAPIPWKARRESGR